MPQGRRCRGHRWSKPSLLILCIIRLPSPQLPHQKGPICLWQSCWQLGPEIHQGPEEEPLSGPEGTHWNVGRDWAAGTWTRGLQVQKFPLPCVPLPSTHHILETSFTLVKLLKCCKSFYSFDAFSEKSYDFLSMKSLSFPSPFPVNHAEADG